MGEKRAIAIAPPRLTPQYPVDGGSELRELERLLDDLAGRLPGEVCRFVGHEVAGGEDQVRENLRGVLFDAVVELNARQSGHSEVRDDEGVGWRRSLRSVLENHLERLGAVTCFVHLPAHAGEKTAKGDANGGLIVDDKDPRGRQAAVGAGVGVVHRISCSIHETWRPGSGTANGNGEAYAESGNANGGPRPVIKCEVPTTVSAQTRRARHCAGPGMRSNEARLRLRSRIRRALHHRATLAASRTHARGSDGCALELHP